MLVVDVSILPILVATVVYFMVGGVWYTMLFGKPWMELSGITMDDAKQSSNSMMYLYTFLLIFVLTYILAIVISHLGAATLGEGVALGALLWLGFVATTMLIDGLYADRPYKLTAINAGYHLTGMVAAASIITVWA